VKRIAVLSNLLPDAWFNGQGVAVVRETACTRLEPVTLRAGMCGYLAFLPALLADVDGLVLTTCCDQMRRAAEWLNDDTRVFLFNMPSTHHQERLLEAEKARLERWVARLPARENAGLERSDARTHTQTGHSPEGHAIGVIGGHFCGDRQAIERFFNQHGIRLSLWGCEGGECVGDVAQRPNDALYEQLKELVRQRQLAGLIVARTTWCDLWRLAAVRLKELLDVPVLEWVTDGQSHGQPFPDATSATRLEAFCELVSARSKEGS